MTSRASILIIDDDPVHLQIYRLVLETAGFKGLPLLVTMGGMEFPEEEVNAVLLDYRLAPNISAREVALETRARYPAAPILMLSDMPELPADTAGIAQAFVRKGNPEKLLAKLGELVAASAETSAAEDS